MKIKLAIIGIPATASIVASLLALSASGIDQTTIEGIEQTDIGVIEQIMVDA